MWFKSQLGKNLKKSNAYFLPWQQFQFETVSVENYPEHIEFGCADF